MRRVFYSGVVIPNIKTAQQDAPVQQCLIRNSKNKLVARASTRRTLQVQVFPGSPVDFTSLKDKTYALISNQKMATLEASRVDFAYKCKNLRTIKLPKN